MSRAFQLMELDAKERSMKGAFALALRDETFHDITLQANDGVQVCANRTILGLRSPVFRTMLFGNFQEANKDVVHMDYPGTIVKALVEHIHTDNAEILVELNVTKSQGDEIPEDRQKEFQMLLTLTAAAAYYSLPKLCHKVQNCLSSYLNAFPLLAFSLLEACSQEGPAIAESQKQGALSKIQTLLLGKGFDAKILESVGPTAIELILVDGQAFLYEQDRFLLIERWCHARSSDADRHPIAKQLVKDHVDLQLIDPDALSASVTASGLVTLEQLTEAYKNQAKRAKHDGNVSFSKRLTSFSCPNPTWSKTDSVTFANNSVVSKNDTLKCPILLAGRRYAWTMEFKGTCMWFGVFPHTGHSDFEGSVNESYGLRCGRFMADARVYSNGSQVGSLGEAVKVKEGGCVTMTLDLSSAEDHNGTLSISVNSQPTIRIYADMLAKLAARNYQGFVPGVECVCSRVKIVCIEEF